MADTSNTSAKEESSSDTSADAGAGAGAGAGAAGAGAGATASFSDFSSKDMVSGSKDFLESNSWVAKLAFLLMVIIGFVILFRLMISFVTWIFSPSGKVVLVNGLQNGSVSSTISQDPNNKSSITILRSENEKDGIEFTWSVWIFIEDSNFGKPDAKYKHIFHKGGENFSVNGQAILLNSPGLYLSPIRDISGGNVAEIRVILNTFDKANETVDINNIPLNKWVNVIIRVTKQSQLDIFINGSMITRHKMTSFPRQNYGDVFVSSNGGFFGNLASLRYFEYAISTSKIKSIYNAGPNKTLISNGENGISQNTNAYLSQRWFLSGNVSGSAPN